MSPSSGTYAPGYPLFVGAIFAATRENFIVLVLAQALLSAIAAVLLYAIARRIVGPIPGALAAVLFALDGNLIQNESTLTVEALLVPLILLAIWTLVRYRETRGWRWLVAAGLALGAAFMTRNVAFLLLLAAVPWLVATARTSARRALRDVTVLAVCLLLVATPTFIATASRGEPRITTQEASLAWDLTSGLTIDNGFLLERGIHPIKDPAGSLGRIAGDPLPVLGFLLWAVPQRLSTLLYSPGPGTFDPVLLSNPSSVLPYPQLLEFLLVLSLALGAFGVFRSGVLRHPDLGLVGGFPPPLSRPLPVRVPALSPVPLSDPSHAASLHRGRLRPGNATGDTPARAGLGSPASLFRMKIQSTPSAQPTCRSDVGGEVARRTGTGPSPSLDGPPGR